MTLAEQAPPEIFVALGRTEHLDIASGVDDLDALGSHPGVAHQPCREPAIGQDPVRAHECPPGQGPGRLYGLEHLVAMRVHHEGQTKPAAQPEAKVALACGRGELHRLRPLA